MTPLRGERRIYRNHAWTGSDNFFIRLLQLRSVKIFTHLTGGDTVEFDLPEGWYFAEAQPAPGKREDNVLAPASARMMYALDRFGRRRAVFIETGPNSDARRILKDAWAATFMTHTLDDDGQHWVVHDPHGIVLLRLPLTGTNPADEYRAIEKSEEWLDMHFPEWRDPSAYWCE